MTVLQVKWKRQPPLERRTAMHKQIITIFCLCDDFLQAYGHSDDLQARMSTAEVMTTALVAAWFFQGHHANACRFLKEHGYIPSMLSPSRFNRRLHQIDEVCWQALFFLLARIYRLANPSGDYIVDSCPVPVCHNLRIRRCKLYRDKE